MPESLSTICGNQQLLDQALDLLAQIRTESFKAPIRPGTGTIASSFCRMLAPYRAFLAGWPGRRVIYPAPDCSSPEAMGLGDTMRLLRLTIEQLEGVHNEDGDRPIMICTEGSRADGLPDWRPSSVGRELQFLAGETAHYCDLIRNAVEDLGVRPGPHFGRLHPVAPALPRPAGLGHAGRLAVAGP
jgi:hypothetical protein